MLVAAIAHTRGLRKQQRGTRRAGGRDPGKLCGFSRKLRRRLAPSTQREARDRTAGARRSFVAARICQFFARSPAPIPRQARYSGKNGPVELRTFFETESPQRSNRRGPWTSWAGDEDPSVGWRADGAALHYGIRGTRSAGGPSGRPFLGSTPRRGRASDVDRHAAPRDDEDDEKRTRDRG